MWRQCFAKEDFGVSFSRDFKGERAFKDALGMEMDGGRVTESEYRIITFQSCQRPLENIPAQNLYLAVMKPGPREGKGITQENTGNN